MAKKNPSRLKTSMILQFISKMMCSKHPVNFFFFFLISSILSNYLYHINVYVYSRSTTIKKCYNTYHSSFLWFLSVPGLQAAAGDALVSSPSDPKSTHLVRIARSAFHVLPWYHLPTIPSSKWSGKKPTTNRLRQTNINHRCTLSLFWGWGCLTHEIVKQHCKATHLMR